jgi:hypothetical protein
MKVARDVAARKNVLNCSDEILHLLHLLEQVRPISKSHVPASCSRGELSRPAARLCVVNNIISPICSTESRLTAFLAGRGAFVCPSPDLTASGCNQAHGGY